MDISGWLGRKYDIAQQNADSQYALAHAQAALTETQNRLAPDEAAARNFAARGSGASAFGSANLLNTNARLAPSLASAEIGERGAQSGLLGAQAGHERYLITPDANLDTAADRRNALGGPGVTGFLNGIFGGGTSPGVDSSFSSFLTPGGSHVLTGDFGGTQPASPSTPGGVNKITPQVTPLSYNPEDTPLKLNSGTSKVPGQGDGTVDKVPAMLAPHEAVLNAGAAEHLGRHTIDFLNAIGAAKMGLNVGGRGPEEHVPEGDGGGFDQQKGSVNGYAMGTPDVRQPPAPGQTVTSGTWTPREGDAGTSSGVRALTGNTGVPRPVPKPQGYAKGTSDVKGEGKAPAKGGKEAKAKGATPPDAMAGNAGPGSGGLTPGVMAAIMAMGQQQGGMPSPQGAAPMPMPMPRVAGR